MLCFVINISVLLNLSCVWILEATRLKRKKKKREKEKKKEKKEKKEEKKGGVCGRGVGWGGGGVSWNPQHRSVRQPL